jgi:hypothetical protein
MGCYPTETILIQTCHSRRLVSANRICPKSTVIIAARSRKHFFQLAIEQLANLFGQFIPVSFLLAVNVPTAVLPLSACCRMHLSQFDHSLTVMLFSTSFTPSTFLARSPARFF